MQVERKKAKASYQDVIDAPEHMVAELIDGELLLLPRPAMRHGRSASVLGMLLGPGYHLGRGGPGGWEIHYEPELHVLDDVLVPDLAGWRRAEHPDLDLSAAFATAAPTWVCEVLSPSTQGKDRVKKLPVYLRAGVQFCWLVDPLSRTLEVFVAKDGHWVLAEVYEGEAEVQPAPFDALPIPLGELWIPEPDGAPDPG